MFAYISGRKTYIVAALTVLYAVIGYYLGNLTFDQAVQLVLGSGGLAALRAGVAKGS